VFMGSSFTNDNALTLAVRWYVRWNRWSRQPDTLIELDVTTDVALYLLKRHSGIVWGPGRFAGLLHGLVGTPACSPDLEVGPARDDHRTCHHLEHRRNLLRVELSVDVAVAELIVYQQVDYTEARTIDAKVNLTVNLASVPLWGAI